MYLISRKHAPVITWYMWCISSMLQLLINTYDVSHLKKAINVFYFCSVCKCAAKAHRLPLHHEYSHIIPSLLFILLRSSSSHNFLLYLERSVTFVGKSVTLLHSISFAIVKTCRSVYGQRKDALLTHESANDWKKRQTKLAGSHKGMIIYTSIMPLLKAHTGRWLATKITIITCSWNASVSMKPHST